MFCTCVHELKWIWSPSFSVQIRLKNEYVRRERMEGWGKLAIVHKGKPLPLVTRKPPLSFSAFITVQWGEPGREQIKTQIDRQVNELTDWAGGKVSRASFKARLRSPMCKQIHRSSRRMRIKWDKMRSHVNVGPRRSAQQLEREGYRDKENRGSERWKEGRAAGVCLRASPGWAGSAGSMLGGVSRC